MRYKLRDDVVLEQVAGEYVLVSLRPAWDELAFVRSVPARHVYMIGCLEKGCSDDEMLAGIELDRYLTKERALRLYHAIKNGDLYHGYLVEDSE